MSGTHPHLMHCLKAIPRATEEPMRFVFTGFLFLAAAGLIVALLIGVAFKLVGLLFLALLVVAGVTWTMKKIRGSNNTLKLDRSTEADRLTR
jgi:hypothetical protein